MLERMKSECCLTKAIASFLLFDKPNTGESTFVGMVTSLKDSDSWLWSKLGLVTWRSQFINDEAPSKS